MALEFYSSIDLNKNELQNAVVQNAGSAPGSPAEGQVYYDSTSGDKAIHFYNGSAWVRLAGQVAAQTTDTIASGDFISFSDESETGDINNKLTVDNLFKTAPAVLDTAAIANGDFVMFLDGGATGETKLEALADVATLFAGSGLTASNSVIAVDTLNQDTTGTATNSLHVLITDNESTDEENQVTFIEGAGGGTAQRGLEADGNFTYNPSSGTVSSTLFSGNYIVGGHTIDDIDITAEFVDADAHIMSSKAIGARFSLKAGSTSVVTTGALDAGSITSNFGTINNGGSAITTTGLISGGSLDIDDVLISGTNIGHTDDTDLIALADGAVTVNGSLTVTGTTTTNNVETVSTSSGVVFEGSSADGNDATLVSVVAGSDKTYTLPNTTGHIGIFTTDPGTTNISATTAELNALDLGSTAVGNAIASKAVVLDSSKDFTGLNSIGSTEFVVGGHMINDIDITSEFVDDNNHIMSSKAIGARFALKNAATTGTATNATNAAHILITDNENTDEENEITFVEGAAGGTANRGLEADGDFTYNPNSGTVTATIFKGNIDAVNGDFDGTLEADALTINGTAIVAQATASAVGGVELATAAEVLTGTDTARVVTADTLAARSVIATIDHDNSTFLNGTMTVTITHNFGTSDVMVQLYDMTTEANVYADIARTTDDMSTASTSVISIDFGTPPPNDVRCIITSMKGATASGTIAYT